MIYPMRGHIVPIILPLYTINTYISFCKDLYILTLTVGHWMIDSNEHGDFATPISNPRKSVAEMMSCYELPPWKLTFMASQPTPPPNVPPPEIRPY